MTNIRSLAIALALSSVLVSACSSDDGPRETMTETKAETANVVTAANTPAGRLLTAINKVRARRGLPPLDMDSRLARAAGGHASDMADNDFFAHEGSDGSSFAGRVTQQGYAYRFVGENIAAGLPSPNETVESWLASPDHRRNVLAANAIHVGIGYAFRPDDQGKADYGHYWVLTVGCATDTGDDAPRTDCGNN